jgi:basic membrane protein A and related proteins
VLFAVGIWDFFIRHFSSVFRHSSFVIFPLRSLFTLLLVSFILAACSSPVTEVTPTAMATVMVLPTATATPEATLTPIPSVKIGYLASSSEVSSVRDAVQRAAQESGWEISETPDTSTEALRGLAQNGAIVVVAEQGDLLQAAREFPSIYFIGLQQENVADLPTNLLALGPGARDDQAGFLAGMVAGLATESQIVTVIGDPNSAEGRSYRNGFAHGVLYTCPECRLLNIDVANLDDGTEASATVVTYFFVGCDVFFAAAGNAGNQALAAAAEAGAGVIGVGEDVYLTRFGGGSALGAEHVLTSIYFDPGAAVYHALSAFHAGQPLSGAQTFTAANNAIIIAPYRDPEGALSMLDQTDITKTLARLADGSLETGIDPATGEER